MSASAVGEGRLYSQDTVRRFEGIRDSGRRGGASGFLPVNMGFNIEKIFSSWTPRVACFRARTGGGLSSRPDGPPDPVATGNMP